MEEVEKKVRLEIESTNRQLQTLVNGLSSENMKLRNRMGELEDRVSNIPHLMVKVVKHFLPNVLDDEDIEAMLDELEPKEG